MTYTRVYSDGTVTIERLGRVEHRTIEELENEMRGELLKEALRKMKETGKNYAIVKCPCCLRPIRITIEDLREVRG